MTRILLGLAMAMALHVCTTAVEYRPLATVQPRCLLRGLDGQEYADSTNIANQPTPFCRATAGGSQDGFLPISRVQNPCDIIQISPPVNIADDLKKSYLLHVAASYSY